MGSPFSTDQMWDAEIQRRERDEDRRVAEFKMNRDMAAIQRATDAQLSYLRALMMRKAALHGAVTPEEATARLDAWLPTLSKERASNHIASTKAEIASMAVNHAVEVQPAVAAPVGIDAVPAGRYAIETSAGATNELAFYKVDRPTEGKWAGRVFVKLMVSDEEQRLSQKQGLAILGKIAEAGAAAASARYGHEIGECGVCGRTLTNDESRERGIGPICAAKNDW
jgi:hypothetical protein